MEDAAQPQTPISKKTNWKKVALTLIFVIFAVGVVIAIYWFLILNKPEPTTPVTTKQTTPSTKVSTPSSKKDETADWKEIKNDVLGYTIKYPKGWGVLRCHESSTDLIADYEIKHSNSETGELLAGVDICGSGARTRIIIFRGKVFSDGAAVWSQSGTGKHTNYKKEEIIVDGKKGVKSSYISKQSPGIAEGIEFIEYIFNGTSDEALIINYYRSPADELNPQQPDYSDILEKMVSTLKFLD